jgi:hypothetical protein
MFFHHFDSLSASLVARVRVEDVAPQPRSERLPPGCS